MTNADILAERAKQEADNYIKRHWGSAAFENRPWGFLLYNHWLGYHDAYIEDHLKNKESE